MLFVLFFVRAIGVLPVMHMLIAELFPTEIRQGLLNRWTSQLDLGCTTGGLERVVSVHNST